MSAGSGFRPVDGGDAFPVSQETVVLLGLGLIGGSLALALRQTGRSRVIGIDRDSGTTAAALEAGAIHRAGTAEDVSAASLLILAVPPRAAIAFLEENAARLTAGTVVTDVCGVKAAVVTACSPLCRQAGAVFVGGHPMAGKEISGFGAADGDLFRGASYLLTPQVDTPAAAVERVERLAKEIGCARVTVTTPEHHDRQIAFTSQLPHVLAGAYVKSPRCPDHKGYSAGSYRDVSRVAPVDENLWSELFLLNREPLCEEIDQLILHLCQCRDAVAAGDEKRLRDVLREGRKIKQRVDAPAQGNGEKTDEPNDGAHGETL